MEYGLLLIKSFVESSAIVSAFLASPSHSLEMGALFPAVVFLILAQGEEDIQVERDLLPWALFLGGVLNMLAAQELPSSAQGALFQDAKK